MKVNFDLAIIDQLGEKLYTQLPPILAEYISNSYDADANNVRITIEKTAEESANAGYIYDISIQDDGLGISDNSDEIEKIFLSFGRKKRIKENKNNSEIYNRPYHGKKGVGKLAGFGCAKKIRVLTIKNNVKNEFCLDYEEIQEKIENDEKDYYVEIIYKDQIVSEKSGTTITLHGVERKTEITADELAQSLAARLQIFSDDKKPEDYFACTINGKNISNSLYYNAILQSNPNQYRWGLSEVVQFLTDEQLTFFQNNHVELEICTAKTPLKKQQGLIVYCRNKLASETEFFQKRHNDNFHTYLYGKVIADFIDEDPNKDYISTERVKINWEKVDSLFYEGMTNIISGIQNEWRKRRKEENIALLQESRLKRPLNKYNKLNLAEQKLCDELLGKIAENSVGMDESQLMLYGEYVEEMFEFTEFQKITKEILESEKDPIDTLSYVQKWNLIEGKEMAKIAQGRIKTLKIFEKMIAEEKTERDDIQPFLEEWPWLLDPSIASFDREKTYESILKQEYPDDKLEDGDSNRRLDFYCVHDKAANIVIIELKRPGVLIDDKIINQANEYRTFLKQRLKNDGLIGDQVVKTIIVVEPRHNSSKKNTRLFKDTIATTSLKEAIIDRGDVNVKTYSELIAAAKLYHKDIIEFYEKLN